MSNYLLLGDWLKQEREKCNLTQNAVAETVGVSQGTVSQWENGKAIPDALEIYRFANLIDLYSLDDIPFDEFFQEGDFTLDRMSLYELPNQDSVKTFEGRIYTLKGFVGIEKGSGTIEAVTDLYYRAKTVVKDNRVIAKRKKENEELKKTKPKKIKLQTDL